MAGMGGMNPQMFYNMFQLMSQMGGMMTGAAGMGGTPSNMAGVGGMIPGAANHERRKHTPNSHRMNP